MVEMLARAVPEGWQIYVKDHPVQFMREMYGEGSRDPAYYEHLAGLPNVTLVPRTTETFLLIDHARAVATPTNTAGWEAVVRGKPVLIFGQPWYRGCPGVFYTPTIKACSEVMNQIEGGYEANESRMDEFLQAIADRGVHGYVEPSMGPVAGISPQANVNPLCDVIVSLHQDVPHDAGAALKPGLRAEFEHE